MIDSARECECIYYFDEAKVSKISKIAICNFVSIPSDNEILLWHNRIGHPNFYSLKLLFPFKFSNNKIVKFQCKICGFTKYK